MKVTLIAHTTDPEIVIARAARTCYSRTVAEAAGQSKQRALIKKLVARGHESVLEHATFTFAVEGLSRTASHQLVRHRLVSFSQQSQRYVSLEEADYVLPPSIASNTRAAEIFRLRCRELAETYQQLVELNIPQEDARFILPQAVTTNLVMTVNARELLHIFRVRLCRRAQWEIQELCHIMLEHLMQLAPAVFQAAGPPCVQGPCPEGEKGCRNPWTRRQS